MKTLWRYNLPSEFSNKNAGFSMWCFGEYAGKEYFIKQFLSPKYPYNDTESSPEKIARRKRACERFEEKHREMYRILTEYSDGNDVSILAFFRIESKYYIATEKIDVLDYPVEAIAALGEGERRRLCAIIAHAVAALHKGHLVHSDIKHDNILYTKTESGRITAKIIDFDGGFLESNPPGEDDEVVGDNTYFSPEVCARDYEDYWPLTCKLDVFALGVLFHQYYTGMLPGFDTEAFACAGEAVYQGQKLWLAPNLPSDIAFVLERMLSRDPNDRPTAEEVFIGLKPYRAPNRYRYVPRPEAPGPSAPPQWYPPVNPPPARNDPFRRPGDL